MVGVTFQEEEFSEALGEMKACTELHYAEITLEKDDIPYDPNWEVYLSLAAAGILHLSTARSKRGLVGYVATYIMPHMHHKGTVFAIQDAYFLKEEYRKGLTGYLLLKFNEEIAKKKGASVITLGVKTDHGIAPIMKRLGYRLSEYNYSKVLGD